MHLMKYSMERVIHMLWENKTICPIELEQGIVIDYVKDAFIVVMKDDVWQEYEMQALQRHKVHFSFLYERVCALFLFAVEDAIETSDASFDGHQCEDAQKALMLEKGACYDVEIYLIDAENKICACRKLTLSQSASQCIKEALMKQNQTPYDEEGFDRALLKIQGVEEPFELEERADFHEVF